MGRSIALLSLELLACTLASRYQFVSRTIPDHFVNKNTAFYDFAFTSLPFWTGNTKEWTASAWMYIESTTYNQMDLITTYRPTVLTSFYGGGEIIVAGTRVPGEGRMIKEAWFHLILGSTSTETFGAFTQRDGTQYNTRRENGGLELTSESKFPGSSNPDDFTVSGT